MAGMIYRQMESNKIIVDKPSTDVFSDNMPKTQIGASLPFDAPDAEVRKVKIAEGIVKQIPERRIQCVPLILPNQVVAIHTALGNLIIRTILMYQVMTDTYDLRYDLAYLSA